MRERKDTLPVRLPVQAIEMLDSLVEVGLHGSNRGEVARNLILDQLKRLTAEGILLIDKSAVSK